MFIYIDTKHKSEFTPQTNIFSIYIIHHFVFPVDLHLEIPGTSKRSYTIQRVIRRIKNKLEMGSEANLHKSFCIIKFEYLIFCIFLFQSYLPLWVYIDIDCDINLQACHIFSENTMSFAQKTIMSQSIRITIPG